LPMEVRQCLLALPGQDRSGVAQIVSYSQALIQCQRYLAREFPQLPLIEWEDTAAAARDLRAGKISAAAAVIAPRRAAEIYGLQVIEDNIQDVNPNITTFIIVNK
jgi:prephenate dehydratase